MSEAQLKPGHDVRILRGAYLNEHGRIVDIKPLSQWRYEVMRPDGSHGLYDGREIELSEPLVAFVEHRELGGESGIA